MAYKPKKFALPPDNTWTGTKAYPPYVFDDEIAIAVDVALATNRPLLVSGPPGSGKTSLAAPMADLLGRRLLRHRFTSRSRLGHLTGELDHVRRLHDAQQAVDGQNLLDDWAYMEPGLLWWAYQPEQAKLRGATQASVNAIGPRFRPPAAPGPLAPAYAVVLLLDGIDNAGPELPHDLLEPLGRRSFQVDNGPEVSAPKDLQLLTIITTTGERDLPQALQGACVKLVLKAPDEKQLIAIAAQHFAKGKKSLHKQIAQKVIQYRGAARQLDRRPPSTGEYLDTIRACQNLKIDTKHETWGQVARATLAKDVDLDPDAAPD